MIMNRTPRSFVLFFWFDEKKVGPCALQANADGAIEDHKVSRAKNDVLAAKINTAEELQSFGELDKLASAAVEKKKG